MLGKLHIGCGTIYIKDYINVDLPSKNCFLAVDRPDLVAQFQTTEDAYYGRHKKTIADFQGPITRSTVCDRYGSFHFIPAHDNSITDILSRQVIEHLSVSELREGLKEANRVLIPNGLFRFSVPDFLETMKQYAITKDSFYIRHFEGPKKDDHGWHTCYSKTDLITILEESGFAYLRDDVNPHIYPAISMCFYSLKQ